MRMSFSIWRLILLALLLALGAHPGVSSDWPRARQAGSAWHPIVCDMYLVGGSQQGRFVTDRRIWRQIRGGERYQVYSPTARIGTATGQAASTDNTASGEQPVVEMQPPPEREKTVAICGDWNALPRPVVAFSNRQAAYVKVAAHILKRHGMGSAHVNITNVLQVDLDGDGTKEVLIAATTPRSGYPEPSLERSDYSFLLLRRLVRGRVQTILLDSEFGGEIRDRSRTYGMRYALVGAFDLNGDGKMEIVTRSNYYEGSSVTVYRLGGKGVVKLLEVGDGA